MAYAGELIVAPYHAIATSTTSSGTFSSETVVDTITVSLVSGKTYAIHYYGNFVGSAANNIVGVTLREDSISGTVREFTDLPLPTATNRNYKAHLYCEYTAVATGAKTFVATGSLRTGSGTVLRYASASETTAYLTVDRIS